MVGIFFGLAVTGLSLIFALTPLESEKEEEESEDIDKLFPIKIGLNYISRTNPILVYCVLAPLVALVGWAYYGIVDIYRSVRPKRIQTAW